MPDMNTLIAAGYEENEADLALMLYDFLIDQMYTQKKPMDGSWQWAMTQAWYDDLPILLRWWLDLERSSYHPESMFGYKIHITDAYFVPTLIEIDPW